MRRTTPDTGFAWVVLLASLGCNYVSGVLVYFVGVIHVELLDKFNDDITTTAWAGAVYSSLQMLAAPLASWVVHRFSCRVSVMVGGLCLCVGFLSSAFATSVIQLVFTYGLLAGTGLGLTYSPCLMIITFYFDKFRALASGVSVSACAVGILSGSLLVQAAIDGFGLSGAFMLIGAFSLHDLVFGMLFRPTHHEGGGSSSRRRERAARAGVRCDYDDDDESARSGGRDVEKTHKTRDDVQKGRGTERLKAYEDTYAEEDDIPDERRALMAPVPDDGSSFPRCGNSGSAGSHDGESKGTTGEAECVTVSEKASSDPTNTVGSAPDAPGAHPRAYGPGDDDVDGVRPEAEQRGTTPGATPRGAPETDDVIIICEDPELEVLLSAGGGGGGGGSGKLPGAQEEGVSSRGGDERPTDAEHHPKGGGARGCAALLARLCRGACPDSVTLVAENGAFLSHCTSVLFNGLSVSGVYLHLPEYAITRGTGHTRAAALFVWVGILSLASRLCSGLVLTSPRVNALALSVALQGSCGLAMALFPLFSDTYVGQVAFASLFGLFNGGFFTLINVLTFELVDVALLPAAYGALLFAMGVGYAVGPPLAGSILDAGGTYEMSFIFLGMTAFLSAAFDVIAKCIHSRKKKRAQQQKKPR